ncbi:hypothetical protein KC343_g2741 [Hortaea werneckii]|uniref:Uncharacterized protein n=1 Tax=Hortaea werneckii TaxID=91943 RepID=A0A3M7F1Y2_HORWE|nr:hypothetical protein KC352_g19475 [Hortaea werneckii]KAI7533304.1 hypothetical protein KC317_g19257 [Hortaea werneckii]KAI7608233.1 hypothetical protein KC346_g9692 [Hortaea werneckii]KAI7633777.1 hypothetical protein KC343_g2741 [Hortaea werneckii]KAI7659551.1 hypothetical protein KC319_g8929 [Hortaea werneckii]
MAKSNNEPSEADIILNRTNVALARSQRLIQSWLPPKPSEESAATQSTPAEDDEDDFKGLDETAGIGSKRTAEDEGLPDGALRRKKLASNDKLLEQILGKKAAQQKKKQDANKNSIKSSLPAKQVPMQHTRPQEPESEEEEEEGRAAAFKSKKRKANPPISRSTEPPIRDEGAQKSSKQEEGTRDNHDAVHATEPQPTKDEDSEDERPAKRKTGSYLDELLSQKASKKSKKKNKANPA